MRTTLLRLTRTGAAPPAPLTHTAPPSWSPRLLPARGWRARPALPAAIGSVRTNGLHGRLPAAACNCSKQITLSKTVPCAYESYIKHGIKQEYPDAKKAFKLEQILKWIPSRLAWHVEGQPWSWCSALRHHRRNQARLCFHQEQPSSSSFFNLTYCVWKIFKAKCNWITSSQEAKWYRLIMNVKARFLKNIYSWLNRFLNHGSKLKNFACLLGKNSWSDTPSFSCTATVTVRKASNGQKNRKLQVLQVQKKQLVS